jgi:hypothetical protein
MWRDRPFTSMEKSKENKLLFHIQIHDLSYDIKS